MMSAAKNLVKLNLSPVSMVAYSFCDYPLPMLWWSRLYLMAYLLKVMN